MNILIKFYAIPAIGITNLFDKLLYSSVDIYLAEYDKRTFPKDCKNVLGQGQKCMENIIIKSEEVILHPQYEDSQLQNDVALIRLRNPAPYTGKPFVLRSLVCFIYLKY